MSYRKTPCPHPNLCGVQYHLTDAARAECERRGRTSATRGGMAPPPPPSPVSEDISAQEIGEFITEAPAREAADLLNDQAPMVVETEGGEYRVTGAKVHNDRLVMTVDLHDAQTRQSIGNAVQRVYDASYAGKQVTVPSDEELENDYASFHVLSNGLAGVGVKHNGEIAGLHSLSGDTVQHPQYNVSPCLFDAATKHGGQWLECFDTWLPRAYKKQGLTSVARIPFNREYAPENWNYEKLGEPDLVFMALGDHDSVPRFEDFDDAYNHTMKEIGQ